MARADLLIALVRAGAAGHRANFERAAEALIAEERAKKHGVLATQLAEAMRSRPQAASSPAIATMGGGRPALKSLVRETDPDVSFKDLVLPEAVMAQCLDLVEEHHRRDLLRSYSMEPRNRVLLVGPPGSGKTSLAEALATALMIPLLTVRYDSVVGSYLGETSARLNSMFEQVRAMGCVLFLDEFETLGKERGDTHDSGEIKRVVSSLLLEIDHLPSHVVIVAATNHQELLDRAVWRRMQLRLVLPATTRETRASWFEKWSDRTGTSLGYAPRTMADKMTGASFAELEEFADSVRRRVILAGAETDTRAIRSIVARQISEWQERAKG